VLHITRKSDVGDRLTLFGDERAPSPPYPGPHPGAQRVWMLVAYLGTDFHGFAPQRGQRTVAGALITAIERFVGHTIELACAGRTDTGVHAWGQVIHADLTPPRDEKWTDAELERLQRACSKMLGPEVVVRAAGLAPEGFHARFSATGRVYRYTILNRPVADPFVAATSWHVAGPLDLGGMRLACDPIFGEHDFSSFCRRDRAGADLTRLVRRAEWLDLGEGRLRFEIEASSFCHQMVRSVVGTMVDVGLGRRRAGDMATVIRARDRQRAGPPAPPHGLCLWQVHYPGWVAVGDSPPDG
jgi:tRNA pseudouridine38-40 synthase